MSDTAVLLDEKKFSLPPIRQAAVALRDLFRAATFESEPLHQRRLQTTYHRGGAIGGAAFRIVDIALAPRNVRLEHESAARLEEHGRFVPR